MASPRGPPSTSWTADTPVLFAVLRGISSTWWKKSFQSGDNRNFIIDGANSRPIRKIVQDFTGQPLEPVQPWMCLLRRSGKGCARTERFAGTPGIGRAGVAGTYPPASWTAGPGDGSAYRRRAAAIPGIGGTRGRYP